MAVEDDPKYEEWSKALDHLKEANDRFRTAFERRDPALEAYRLDLHKAQAALAKIAEEIETE